LPINPPGGLASPHTNFGKIIQNNFIKVVEKVGVGADKA